MKKQFIVQKYVMADSVKEVMEKSKKIPIHEVFVHNNWFEKTGYEWSSSGNKRGVGFKSK